MIPFLDVVGDFLLKIIIAFVIFLIGLIIGKFAGMIITKLLYELQIDQILETIGIKFFLSSAVGTVVSLVIYIIGLILALDQLGLTKIFTILLVVFFSALMIIAVLLGITSTVKNLFIGFYIRKKFLDKKALNSKIVSGKIVDVGYTRIKVMTKEKDVLVVPFSAFVD
ncbi:hypothetical protein KY308_03805 [Candidatus Woesearchaeota archaeon]|nr:hypothetical protein [Candidatus Woesearchaeota archaeon]